MTNLHLYLVLTWHSDRLCSYVWGCLLVSEAVRFSKSRGAVVQRSNTTSPTSTPKLLLSTGPVFSCKGIAKGTRFKSTIVIVILSNTDILDLQTSLFSIPDKQLETSLHVSVRSTKKIFRLFQFKHCQRHNGPEGWVHLIKVTSWGYITRTNTNLDQIHLQNLD